MTLQVFHQSADLLQAIAHPRRLEIINLLRDQTLDVTSIYLMLDLPQANISQHLMILKKHGIVATSRQGKHIFYSLSDPRYLALSDMLQAILKHQIPHLKDMVPLVHDPVCGMHLSQKTAAFTAKLNNQVYYFCASGCYQKFTAHPAQYV